MKKLLFLFSILMLSACVHSPKQTEIVELSNGNYQISAISEKHWSGVFLTAELLQDAEKFCQKRNLEFVRLTIKKEDARRFNYANSVVVFRCNSR